MKYFVEGIEIVNKKTIKTNGWIISNVDQLKFQLIVNDKVYEKTVDLVERKDVKDYFGGTVKLNSGFDVSFTVKEGVIKRSNEIILVECYENHELYRGSIEYTGGINYCLDDVILKPEEGEMEIRGWAFSISCRQAVNAEIRVNGKSIYEFQANKMRKDVKRMFPDIIQAENSGFAKHIALRERSFNTAEIVFCDNMGHEVSQNLVLNKVQPEKLSECYTIFKQMGKLYNNVKKDGHIRNLKKYISDTISQYNEEYGKVNVEPFLQHKKKSRVWLENNHYSEPLKEFITSHALNQKISIVLFSISGERTNRAIQSILDQKYESWKLYIIPIEEKIVSKIKRNDKRIILCDKEKYKELVDEFSTNKGMYIALMDDSVVLEDMAFSTFFSQGNRKSDLYYADSYWENQDYLFFKPAWSPQLLLSYNYIGNFVIVRGEILSFEMFDFSQGYSLMYSILMAVAYQGVIVEHIPQVLYKIDRVEFNKKKYRHVNIIQKTLCKMGLEARILYDPISRDYLEPVFQLEFSDYGPEVQIIVLAMNRSESVKRCVASLKKTSYNNYRITVIDNDSGEKIMDDLQSLENTARYVLFLDSEAEILDRKWLSNMMGYMLMDNVGIVGARLVTSNKVLHNAGIVIGVGDSAAEYALKSYPKKNKGYMLFPHVTRNCSAVTDACMLIPRELFFEVGGFDEISFTTSYKDIDLCLRVLEKKNKDIVYAANSMVMYHDEVSRLEKYIDGLDDLLVFKRRYKNYVDKFYNPNLSLENADYEINPDNSIECELVELMKVKLIAVSHNLKYEGAPIQLLEILDGLQREGIFDIEIWSPDDGPLREKIENKCEIKTRILPFHVDKKDTISEYKDHLRAFSNMLKEQNVRILVANTLDSFYAIDAANETNIPSVWLIHESCEYDMYFEHLQRAIYERYLSCFGKAYKLLFVSQTTRKMFDCVDVRNSAFTIHNGLFKNNIDCFKKSVSKTDARRYLGIPDQQKILLCVGTTCERKRQLDLVKAVVDSKRSDITLYLVGGREGRYLDYIEDFIEENDLGTCVKIIMETDQVNYYYRASDLFVCASENESYPRVILEAMAFDLPVIATGVFGIKEQIFDGINGFLFQPGDKKKLGELIDRVLSNDEEYNLLSKNASKVLELISDYDEMIHNYKRILIQMKYLYFDEWR